MADHVDDVPEVRVVWVYEQVNGRLSHDGRLVTYGYSGTGRGENRPDMDAVRNTGPAPKGVYLITQPFTHPETGPDTMRLVPQRSTNAHGRDGFMIHGDYVGHEGQVSHGGLVFGRSIRLKIWDSNDHIIIVK
ncbi:DUF2778 domain-containing protein [Acetobacter sp. AN02]|uniref:tlde1 domain-containing protein n=1 Tax=Acetobacter sp. AN02 TaxID=2894186 RepID=UPI0024341DA9|nr:tlde1 domain-containing protein [Acetobacter sp. AN02]MDG6094276.1 DUF2778 domain-containing protein [Acetobacter sp. AN02]